MTEICVIFNLDKTSTITVIDRLRKDFKKKIHATFVKKQFMTRMIKFATMTTSQVNFSVLAIIDVI